MADATNDDFDHEHGPEWPKDARCPSASRGCCRGEHGALDTRGRVTKRCPTFYCNPHNGGCGTWVPWCYGGDGDLCDGCETRRDGERVVRYGLSVREIVRRGRRLLLRRIKAERLRRARRLLREE